MTYDYRQVSFTSPWKVMTGRYTREGDVRELLLSSDDMFVISRPGDELILSFEASKLPPLPEGWTRTFLLYADGFSKEMDINSASPDQVGPLPFHGMSRYPYAWPERYPLTPKRRKYLETYNTRIVTSSVPSVFSFLLSHKGNTDFEGFLRNNGTHQVLRGRVPNRFSQPARPPFHAREHGTHAVDDRLRGRGRAPFLPVRLVVFPEFAHAAPVFVTVAELLDKLAIPIPTSTPSGCNRKRKSTTFTFKAAPCSRSIRSGRATSSTPPASLDHKD